MVGTNVQVVEIQVHGQRAVRRLEICSFLYTIKSSSSKKGRNGRGVGIIYVYTSQMSRVLGEFQDMS